MSSSEIYLDNAGTTRPVPSVLDTLQAVSAALTGNASSLHSPGVRAARFVEQARATLARALSCPPDAVIFTSGGTESNNLAVKGALLAAGLAGKHVVTTQIEHPSVYQAARFLSRQGCRVTFLPVDPFGRVTPAQVAEAITDRTVLVSVMHANNETGALQPIAEIGAICRARGVLFHVDACQSFTKEPLEPTQLGLDLVSLSAHKLHGPRGVGALYVRPGLQLEPLLHGGGQEFDLRSGTRNTEGVAAFGAAVEAAFSADVEAMRRLSNHLLNGIEQEIDGVTLNGPREDRLDNIINLGIDGVDGKALSGQLNRRGVIVATGSACMSTKKTASRVLLAMGLSQTRAHQAIRISISRHTTRAELDRALEILVDVVHNLREEAPAS